MQRVSLFGYGKTTKALAKKIVHQKKDAPHAIFYDDKVTEAFRDENGFMVQPANTFNPDASDLEIPSPGIPPCNPLILKAKHIQSEYDFFTSSAPKSIWISGTNGKTTTTQMMQYLLKDKESQEGGNIGTPLAELNPHASMWILETSSFTMHYTNIAKPNIYVLLPLTPDHVSWHGSMEEYIRAKLKPLGMMGKEDVALIPEAYKDVQTNARIITYKDANDLAEHFGIECEKVKFKGAFLADALLAMAVDKILFKRIQYETINSFIIEAHRQEELKDTLNRLWVNDTKATNLDASIAALNRYKDSFIHLILGGDDKGVELDELFVFLQTIHVKIYNIGSNKEKLSNLAEKYNISYNKCKNLLDAVYEIDKVLKKEEVALLSPAGASLDEFTSYAQRGDIFREAVRSIS